VKQILKTPREPRDCIQCGAALPLLRHYKQYLCADCKSNPGLQRAGWQAHRLVGAAIRLGFLLPVSACRCVDCGAQATDYDHRDYNKPLEVDPVCRSCNFARPPAVQFRPAPA